MMSTHEAICGVLRAYGYDPDTVVQRWYDRQTDNVPDWDTLLTPAQIRFAEEEHADPEEVARFVMLGTLYANARTRECNGDPWGRAGKDTDDKNINARLWCEQADKYGDEMTVLVKNWGFDHLDFGVGLYPTLQRGPDDTTGTVHFSYEIKGEEDTD